MKATVNKPTNSQLIPPCQMVYGQLYIIRKWAASKYIGYIVTPTSSNENRVGIVSVSPEIALWDFKVDTVVIASWRDVTINAVERLPVGTTVTLTQDDLIPL